ncbi:MAG: hypothetical protein IAI50_11130 [Candidatus Eremiobacteraeota bacterium]|nr:hypothetical protein [Candidatus Eremiobacteraeota bacterium]
MRDELAQRIVPGSRVVVVGDRDPAVADALRAGGCDVTTVVHPNFARNEAAFDVAIFGEFREDWRHPSDVLRELRSSLCARARVLVSRAGTERAAVRVAVYGESVGENVAPVVRGCDLDRFGVRALGELLGSAGFRVIAGMPNDEWIEGVAIAGDAADGAPRVAAESATESPDRAELRELRTLVRTVLERQRRLHEELARLRASIARRDETLALLRSRLEDRAGANLLAQERLIRLEATEVRLAEARAQIADLEARRLRLTEVVRELRERD